MRDWASEMSQLRSMKRYVVRAILVDLHCFGDDGCEEQDKCNSPLLLDFQRRWNCGHRRGEN
jgi:hypothetical protein